MTDANETLLNEVHSSDELGGVVPERCADCDLPNGCPEYCWCGVPSVAAAEAMGAKGGQAGEGERLAFEAWMRGHCWALCAHWDGKQYISDEETNGCVSMHAMVTRRLWAAWRDRAALARLKTPNVELSRQAGREGA